MWIIIEENVLKQEFLKFLFWTCSELYFNPQNRSEKQYEIHKKTEILTKGCGQAKKDKNGGIWLGFPQFVNNQF